jgi:hypothetical protein
MLGMFDVLKIVVVPREVKGNLRKMRKPVAADAFVEGRVEPAIPVETVGKHRMMCHAKDAAVLAGGAIEFRS